jgi:hypothetical protein
VRRVLPLDTYPVDALRVTYSRPVMREMARRGILDGLLPENLVSLEEAEAYWSLRETVHLVEIAVAANPQLEAMLLCGTRDHVQSMLGKPHVRQAFDAWSRHGTWVKINPSSAHLQDLGIVSSGTFDLPANAELSDWKDTAAYAMPSSVPTAIYQVAAIYEMADRARARSSTP